MTDTGASLSHTVPGVGPRAAALDVVLAVLRDGRSLSRGLEARAPLPDRRDEALTRELCYGVLRRRRQLEGVLHTLMRRPLKRRDADVEVALMIGIYQLLYLRTTAHAVVATSAALGRRIGKPWATGLINGVLRTFLRQRGDLTEEIAHGADAERSHPRWLVDAIRNAWPECWRDILRVNDEHPPMTLRVNPTRTGREEYLARLRDRAIAAWPAPHCAHGVTLEHARMVSELPGFHSGEVSVQDAAAQLAAPLLDPPEGARVLDACAAPGGKTAHLLEHCPGLRLSAVDSDADRLGRIRDNLDRLGLRATLKKADACEPDGWWDGHDYDRILIDAPCSATGVIRRHPDVKWLRRPEDPARLARRQRLLLSRTWPTLARRGSLLYATCSILPSENDEVIARFLATHRDARALDIPAAWGVSTRHGRQILPGEAGMDGFYYALLFKV